MLCVWCTASSTDLWQIQLNPFGKLCHKLTHRQLTGIDALLSLGLNYCIKPSSTTKTTDRIFDWIRKDLRCIHAFAKQPPEEQEHNRKLYIQLDCEFDPALPKIEQALNGFKSPVKSNQLANNQRRKPWPNLTLNQHKLLLHLDDKHVILIVIPANKSLGPVSLDHVMYIERACQKQLSDGRNYKQIKMNKTMCIHGKWRYYSEKNCLLSIQTYGDQLVRFHIIAKLHKDYLTIPPFRPIVCYMGTFLNCWSKLLDL